MLVVFYAHLLRINSSAVINSVVKIVLPMMLIISDFHSKKEKASRLKNAEVCMMVASTEYLINEVHSIDLHDGKKFSSLVSLGVESFKKKGTSNPVKHVAPAATPGVLVNISINSPKTKPMATYAQRGVSPGKINSR